MSDEDIDVAITRLVGVYSKDLSSDFPKEFRQCVCWIKRAETRWNSIKWKCLDNVSNAEHYWRLSCISEHGSSTPNFLLATNYSGERSFSHLKRIKDVKRSTMCWCTATFVYWKCWRVYQSVTHNQELWIWFTLSYAMMKAFLRLAAVWDTKQTGKLRGYTVQFIASSSALVLMTQIGNIYRQSTQTATCLLRRYSRKHIAENS